MCLYTNHTSQYTREVTVPITKEHMKDIVDEALTVRDHYDRFRAEIASICDHPDPGVAIELIRHQLAISHRPGMEKTYAESLILKRNWSMNQWKKNYQIQRRMAERAGGDPNAVQMFPRPASGSRYTFIG